MNESTLTQEPVTLETQPKNKSNVLRGPVPPTNRVKNFVSTRIIAPVVIGLATLGSPSESQGADRKDVAIAALVGLGVGAVVTHAIENRERAGNFSVSMNDKTRTELQAMGFKISPDDQSIDRGTGVKIHFKYLCKGAKSAEAITLSGNQILLRFVYQKPDGEYRQSVIYNLNEMKEGDNRAGLKSYTQEQRNR